MRDGPGSGYYADEMPVAVPCRPIGDIDPEAHTRLMRDLSGEARAFAGDVRMAEAVCRNRSRQIEELKTGFRAAYERTRARYGLSEEECRELWGTEEST